MKLKTSRGLEYMADFADVASHSGQLMIQIRDERRLPEIAAEFDGLEWIERKSENQGDKRFAGFCNLQRILRVADGSVLIGIGKETD